MLKRILLTVLMLLSLMLAGCGRKNADASFTSVEDFAGKRIGIQTGTLYEDYLLEKNPDAIPEFYTDPNTMVVAVGNQKLDAYITDSAAFSFERKMVPGLAALKDPLALAPVSVGIGQTERQELLLSQINEFIAACREDGTLEAMDSYWIENGDEDHDAVDRSGITGENGRIVVGVEGNYVPFSYMNEGLIEGYDVDFAYRFCRKYGYAPEIVPMEYDAISPALSTGKCDLGMNILYDEEREEEISLSDSYYTVKILLVYFSEEAASLSSYHSFADFSGKKVGIETGTLYEDLLLQKNPDAIPEFFTDPNMMIVAVKTNKLDAYVTDSAAFPYEQQSFPALVCLEEPLALVSLRLGVGNNEKKDVLLSQLNEFIADCKEDGTMESMMAYWHDSDNVDHLTVDRSGITGENGKVIFGLEGGYVPFSFLRNGLLEGQDVDFAYRFCRRYGYEPEVVAMDFDGVPPALATGKCDVGVILYDEERAEEITLTDECYTTKIVLAYNGGEKSSVSFFSQIVNSFDKTFIKDNRWKEFANGALISILISAMSILLGTVCGLALYVLCRKGNRLLNRIVDLLSNLIVGTPAVLLLMIFYFIIFGNVDIEKIVVAIISFTLLFTVSMFSMLQSGEGAVGVGQYEAALSQGFSELAAYFRIVLPQSAIHFLPQYFGEAVSLIKETSIVGYIAILDLTKISDMVRGRTFEPFFPLISTTIIYFLISWLLTLGAKLLYKALCPQTRNLKRAFRDIQR